MSSDQNFLMTPADSGSRDSGSKLIKMPHRMRSGHDRWTHYRSHAKLVNPANRRKHSVIIVGTGACRRLCSSVTWRNGATRLKIFVCRIPPRRAHSISAQGGITMPPKNYKNDGDSASIDFYDTVERWRLSFA